MGLFNRSARTARYTFSAISDGTLQVVDTDGDRVYIPAGHRAIYDAKDNGAAFAFGPATDSDAEAITSAVALRRIRSIR